MSHPIIKHLPFHRPSAHSMKKILLLPALVGGMALCSCKDESAAPPQFVVQTEPVGNGLVVIAFAMVGAAVVIVLGRLLR